MAMIEKIVPYEVNGRPFEGKIVYDDSVKGKRPAVYMQPDWKGIDADTTGQAREVAGKDYVLLMADMFGKGYGDKPKDQTQLRAGMLAVHKDRPFTLACGKKSFEVIKLKENLDSFFEHVKTLRPPTAKGIFIEKASVSATMSPGVRVDVGHLAQ